MKVELEIKDDKELRNVIKDMIRGQVVSIVREEVKELVATEVKKKTSEALLVREIRDLLGGRGSQDLLCVLVSNAITALVTEEVKEQIQTKAHAMLYSRLQEIDSRINEAIKHALSRLKVSAER